MTSPIAIEEKRHTSRESDRVMVSYGTSGELIRFGYIEP